jgi:signal transduction histidine kinase
MEAETPKRLHINSSQEHLRISPEWQMILRLLEAPTAQVLQLDGLFLFEFDKDSEQSPLLVLRAATGKLPYETCVPLDEAALATLNQAVDGPLAVDTSRPFGELNSLVSLIARQGCSSALVGPLQHQERLAGCLVGYSIQRRCFTPAEQSIFSLLASYVGVAIENARLRANPAIRLSEAMSLQAVCSALVEAQSLDAILELIIDEAVRLTNARDALVLLLEEGGDWFQVCARKGSAVAGLMNGRLSVKDSLNGLVVTTGQPLVSQDAMTDPRADQARARRLNVRTVAIAPLLIQHKVIGTIAVHNKRDGCFSQADVEVLSSFANQAAIAINNARLFAELLRARDEVAQKAQELQELLIRTMTIQEDERRRIAVDIHDGAIPLIVGGLYEVEACLQLCQLSKNVHERLQVLQQLLNDAVEETRKTIYNLWPTTLDQIGLLPALRELINHQEKIAGIPHSLRVNGSPYELAPSARIVAYRIVQEALNNIRQHAAANSVDMLIRFSPQRVHIVIRDDGNGFDTKSVMLSSPGRNFGLIGMRERALSVGGSLQVDSIPGEGVQVVLEIPATGVGIGV